MPDIVGLEKHKQTSLRGIAEKARACKQHRFQNLYRCLDVKLLTDCWRGLNKKAASGVDKVTVEMYAENLHRNIRDLVDRLKTKHYRAKLVRRCYIPKGNGKERPLGIPALEDKLVQLGCAKLLSAIYEQDFREFSYGYRPGKNAKEAVCDLSFNLQYGRYRYIVEADIKGFFDNLDHEWLMKMLEQRVDDQALLGLIRKWLKAGILDRDGSVIHPETGTPQGGIISPILANVYLHYVLDLWFEKIVKPHCAGEAIMCRYADDWVCAFRYQQDAQRFYEELPKRLAKFNLEVAPEKTQVLRFSCFHPSMERRFTFLGFELYWFKDRKGVPRVMRRTSRKKMQAACQRIKEWIKRNRHMRSKEFFRRLNAFLVGYYNYYGLRGNFRSLERVFYWVVKCAFKWLNRRGGKRRSFNWSKFYKMLCAVHIARPRITEARKMRKLFA